MSAGGSLVEARDQFARSLGLREDKPPSPAVKAREQRQAQATLAAAMERARGG